MQQIDELLSENGTDAGEIGRQFGLSPDQTRQAMASLIPAIMGGFQKRADANDLESVAGLAQDIDDPATAVAPGNAILGQIFGSKDVSRQVATHAAGNTGISNTVLKSLLPIVAAMVGQHLMRRMAGGLLGGLAGGVLGSVLGNLGGGTQAPASGQADGGGLGGILGGGAGGGNPLDAILGGLVGARR